MSQTTIKPPNGAGAMIHGAAQGSLSAQVGGVTAMIHGAVQGGLSAQAGDLLIANLDETVLMGCIGASIDDIDAADATLVCVVLDMSSSMSPHKRGVIDAYNAMRKALAGSKSAASILLSAWAFSDAPRLLSGYQPVSWQKPLTPAQYDPDGCTALYDTLLGCMTGLVAYGQQLLDNGVPNRRILFVLSDGGDNASKSSSLDVRTAARALLAQEVHTLAYAGFGSPDLAKLAAEVGFPAVVTTGATESDLRKIFRQVSASVIRVSQATGAGAGGFF